MKTLVYNKSTKIFSEKNLRTDQKVFSVFRSKKELDDYIKHKMHQGYSKEELMEHYRADYEQLEELEKKRKSEGGKVHIVGSFNYGQNKIDRWVTRKSDESDSELLDRLWEEYRKKGKSGISLRIE